MWKKLPSAWACIVADRKYNHVSKDYKKKTIALEWMNELLFDSIVKWNHEEKKLQHIKVKCEPMKLFINCCKSSCFLDSPFPLHLSNSHVEILNNHLIDLHIFFFFWIEGRLIYFFNFFNSSQLIHTKNFFNQYSWSDHRSIHTYR